MIKASIAAQASLEAPWYYNNQPLTESDIPADAFGFIYHIQYFPHRALGIPYSGPTEYIGKKQLVIKTSRNAAPHKQLTKKGVPFKRPKKIQGTKSTWGNYFGSCVPIQELVTEHSGICFRRTILKWAKNKRELSYYEDKYLFCENVLENPRYFNDQIGGRFYRKHLFPV